MLLSFGKKWVCSYIQILQLTSTSRLCQSKPWELRFLPEGRKQGSATGISKRNLYSGCWKLASWLLVSWLPGIPISVTQALSPGSDLTLTVRSDYIGQTLHHQMWFLYKMVKPLQREHGPGLQQFKIELKWITCGHHVDLNDCCVGITLNLLHPQNTRKSTAHLKKHFTTAYEFLGLSHSQSKEQLDLAMRNNHFVGHRKWFLSNHNRRAEWTLKTLWL